MASEDLGVSGPSPSPVAVPPTRRSALWSLGIVLGVLVALGLAGFLWYRANFGGTTVTVTNVGDLPVEGIVVLAVSEGSDEVRFEQAIGTLRPGETRNVEHVFPGDTNLAVRIRAANGTNLDDRLPIYLGSPSTQYVRVDLTTSGVVRALYRQRGGQEWTVEGDGIQRGLELTGRKPK